jgi:hypothetical protein
MVTFPGPKEPDDSARHERLSSQLAAVLDLMSDGQPRTIAEISRQVETRYGVRCPENSASAQLRHLRKNRFGGHVVLKSHVGRGLYEYRLRVGQTQQRMWE